MRKRLLHDSEKAAPALPYRSIPAKTFLHSDGKIVLGRGVHEHCLIVGHVAREIINRCFPGDLAALFPKGSELLVALHDIGKASPTFVEKIMRATFGYVANSHPGLEDADPQIESQWGGHAGVSQAELQRILPFGLTPFVAGQHHGYMPDLKGKTALAESFGSSAWHEEREKLISALCFDFDNEIPDIRDVLTARLVSGLTTVSDWIGSAGQFNNPAYEWRSNIGAALDGAGFKPLEFIKNLSFKDVFGFAPNEIQRAFMDQVKGPGVYVLEAQMGRGKTEAALYAAYNMVQQGKARGIYFALPTKLTSNKIHERMAEFAKTVLPPDSPIVKPMLLHGSAWYMQDLDFGEDGAPGGSWFSYGKRGILAPLAVGTIDQALLAVMNVKHGFLRTFGLAGKVVIIDEVHSYDNYTGTILNSLIKTLVGLKCTVIVLSATLNLGQKRDLLDEGCGDNQYPLVTAKPVGLDLVETAPVPIKEKQMVVALSKVHDDRVAQRNAMARAAEGQQVLWIENTVAQAQDVFRDLCHLADGTHIECGLIHSRFIPAHRQINEDHWVETYGKKGAEKRSTKGRILVGTQVLEQSIDIDADYLVTRFCPTDMLLQRLGRLWRHAASVRPDSARCEACLITPSFSDLDADIKKAFGSSSFVYDPYVLYRAHKVWADRTAVSLPQDIRPLIDETYVETPHDNDQVARLFFEMENGVGYGRTKRPGRNQLKQFAKNTLTTMGAQVDDETPPTRYSDQETVEVLLIKAIESDPSRQVGVVTFLDGNAVEIPWTKSRISRKDSRKIAMLLAQNTVSVSPKLAPEAQTIGAMKAYGFHNVLFLGHPDKGVHEYAAVRVGLICPAGRINNINAIPTERQIFYRQDMGYWKEGD